MSAAVTPAGPVSVSVVVPVYGNADSLAELVERIRVAFVDSDLLEIVLVDDESPDESWRVIRGLAASDLRVRGILLAANVGAITAIAVGCEQATGAVICSIDADLENRPEDLPRLVDRVLDGHDLVGAVRIRQHERPFLRRMGTVLTRIAVHGVLAWSPRDFGCGMKAWRAELGRGLGQVGERRDVNWAVDLFNAASSYAEVETPWQDQRRRSSFGVMRKLMQAVVLVAAVRPRSGSRLLMAGGATVTLAAVSRSVASGRRVRSLWSGAAAVGLAQVVVGTSILSSARATRRSGAPEIHIAGRTD